MRSLFPLFAVLILVGVSAGQVIDHNDIAGVSSYSQDTMNAIGQLKFFFQHASVGDNIKIGIQALYNADQGNPRRYQLTYQTVSNTQVPVTLQSPPSPTVAGKVYDAFYQTGIGDKPTTFADSVTNVGWRYSAVDVAVMKFCYIDAKTTIQGQIDMANDYLDQIAALEQAYPQTKFVYVTQPTLVYRATDDPYFPTQGFPTYAEYWDNQELIQEFNNVVRSYCAANGKLLYDLADMESHDPQGNAQTIQWHSKTIEVGYQPYYWAGGVYNGSNNGHLVTLGRQQAGLMWYAMAAAAVGGQGPVAVNDSYTTLQNTTLNVSAPGLLANDLGSSLQAVKDTNPSHGTVTVNTNGSFTYTPTGGYTGPDSFTYHVTNSQQSSASATVSLTVGNNPPVANNDSYSVNQDTTLSVSAPGVLANDTDPDSGTLTVTQVTDNVDHGSLTLNSNGSFVYTPTGAYSGPDAFTYQISDGQGGTDTAVASITVNSTGGGGEETLYADYGSHERDGQNSANGSETSYTYNNNYTIYVHFDLSAVDFQIESATLRLYQSSAATNTINISAYRATQSWAEATLDGTAYPTYDSTILGTATCYQSGGTPAWLEITLDAATIESMRTGTNYGLRLKRSNTTSSSLFYFDSDEGTNRPELVLVGAGGSGNTPPVATTDYYTNLEDQVLGIPEAGVLDNDTDADSDPITAELVTGPTHGSVDLETDGSFVYTPNPNYDQSDSFTYRAYDGEDYSNTVTVTIQMTPANDAPVAAADSGYSVDQNSYVTISAPGVLANDTDIDSASITAANASDPAHGSVTLNANGSFTYTPDAGYSGPDSFTYQAYDGAAYSTAATVSITVNAGGGDPETVYATADAYVNSGSATTNYGTATSVQVRYSGGAVQRQAYLYFDLSGLGFTVNGATLRVYQNGTASTSVTVDVYAAANSWVETSLTWSNQPGTTGSSLGNFATRTTGDGNGWVEVTLTASAIEAMRTGNNYGLILVPRSGGTTNTITFQSRETNPGSDPELVVTP